MNWDEVDKANREAKNADQAESGRIFSKGGSTISIPPGMSLADSTSYYIYSPWRLATNLGLPTAMIYAAIENKSLPSMIHERKLVVLHPFSPVIMNRLMHECREWNSRFGIEK